jgi:hypothetical protein
MATEIKIDFNKKLSKSTIIGIISIIIAITIALLVIIKNVSITVGDIKVNSKTEQYQRPSNNRGQREYPEPPKQFPERKK